MKSSRVHQLFLLNLCLQLFDGIATYEGLRWHWSEGNPLLLAAIPYLGVGTTLLLFKAKACGFPLAPMMSGMRAPPASPR